MSKKKGQRLTNCTLSWPTECVVCERKLLPGWKVYRKQKKDKWVTLCTRCRGVELQKTIWSNKRPAPGRRARFVTGRP